jgi:hypothetical protein
VPESAIPITVRVIQNGHYNLPKTVVTKFTDGTYRDMPVTWSSGTVSLNKVGMVQITGTIDNYGIAAALTLDVVEDKEVTIADNILKSIICNSLGKVYYGQAIYLSDILSLTSLKYSGTGTIATLSGIENMTNLTELELNGYTISSLSGLQSLTNLKRLTLRNDGITDISSLSSLTNLEYLDLRLNKITNISALKGLTRLKYLYLAVNYDNDKYLTDYSPVRMYYDNLIEKDFIYN